MIALIQRVNHAQVSINKKIIAKINYGYVVLLGICRDDSKEGVIKLVDKIVDLRIMSDENGKMNRSIIEIKGEILLISQFTLCANLKGGRRPDFFPAMEPVKAKKLYNLFIEMLKSKNIPTESGIFGANMQVELINNGPVAFIVDTANL